MENKNLKRAVSQCKDIIDSLVDEIEWLEKQLDNANEDINKIKDELDEALNENNNLLMRIMIY